MSEDADCCLEDDDCFVCDDVFVADCCLKDDYYFVWDNNDTSKRYQEKMLFVTSHDATVKEKYLFAQKKKYDSDLKTLILLDNQSTTDLFGNKNFLTNIRTVDDSLCIVSNGGEIICKKKGTLTNYGEVWYNPDAVTNILSLSNVTKKHRVTFNSNKG